jgi:hypothetical protein
MSTWFETCGHVLRHVFVIVGVFVVGGALITLILMYSGIFNVAATVVDSSPLNWALVTVREASIRLHSRDVQPAKPVAAADRDNGFRIYRQECAMCHTPIGRTPRPMAVGFNPQAPHFGPGADLIPTCIDYDPRAHLRRPMVMMRQGCSMSLFHASQQ